MQDPVEQELYTVSKPASKWLLVGLLLFFSRMPRISASVAIVKSFFNVPHKKKYIVTQNKMLSP